MTEMFTRQLECLTPILCVSNFRASMEYYTEKLGFTKAWEWGDPPGFGCVSRDRIEIFLCQGGQGQPGTWLAIFVADADALHEELNKRGARISGPPEDKPWGMREFNVEDPDGHTIRFGHATFKIGEPLPVERVTIEARLEKRLAAVLQDLAAATKRTVGEVLEETLLHTFEPVEGKEGFAVASPHRASTFQLIESLKQKHGLDYDVHANYRFKENGQDTSLSI